MTKGKPGSPASSPGNTLIRRLAEALDEQRIPYVIIGGQAVIQHGYVRATTDVDFTVPVPPSEANAVITLAHRQRLQPKMQGHDEQAFAKLNQLLRYLDPESQLGVDFSFVDSDYVRDAVLRSTQFTIDDYPVRFLSVEDLVIHKVIADRPRDREDTVELLSRYQQVDIAYIRRWLRLFEEVLECSLIDRLEQRLIECRGDSRP